MATNTTATTQNHNGTGSQNNFAISFAFLANTEVDVKVGGVLKTLGTHYNIVGSQVQFTSGNTPPSGTANVVFIRDTNISAKKVDFADGSVLTETDLDNNSDQILFAQQEFTNDYVKRDGSQTITGNLVFEGATDDGNETTLAITDPTADRTITVPDRSGTIITSGDTGTVTSTMIADGTIVNGDIANSTIQGNTKIVQDSITGVQIAANSIGASELADNSVDTNALQDGNVTRPKIAADAIDSTKLADNAVNSEHYVDSSIDHEHLANDIIDGDNVQDNAINNEHIAANAVRVNEIKDGEITSAKLNPSAVITASEQGSATTNDTSFLTSAAADARFFNISSGDTIKDGQTFPDNDTTIATTAAINDRIIDLVDDVGGFVPIANETSFPTSNPDVNNGAGTIVSVSAASTNLTPSGTTVTIANGRGSGLAVIITGVSSTIPSGFGFLVETTTTAHTYTFHRLSPKATEVTTVAGKATEIGRLGTADAVADMAILGTADVVADMAILGTTDVVADMNTLGTADVVSDMNTLAVTSVINNMDTVATNVTNVNNVGGSISNVNTTAGSIANVNTVAGSISNVNNVGSSITNVNNVGNSISNVNTVATNISSVNSFFNTYRIGSSNPTTSLDTGDLFFNTTSNSLKVYTGSAWVDGVTATGNFALKTGNTFTGSNVHNDNVKSIYGTGSDLEIYHSGSHSYIVDSGTGNLILQTSKLNINNAAGTEALIHATENGKVELYYDNSVKLETTNNGVSISGDLELPDGEELRLGDSNDLQLFHDGSNSNIYNASGNLRIRAANNLQLETHDGEMHVKSVEDGQVELYFDNSKKIETVATGAYVYGNLGFGIGTTGNLFGGDNDKILLGNGNDLQIYHDGTNSYIENSTGDLILKAAFPTIQGANGETILNAGQNGAVNLYFNNSKKFETYSGGIEISGHAIINGNTAQGDNQKAQFGDSQDLQIFHDASHSRIHDAGTGDLRISGSAVHIQNQAQSENMLRCFQDGQVELYHNNAKKLQTQTYGVSITDGELRIGDASDGNDALIRLGATGTNTDTHGVMFYDKSDNSMSFVVSGESHGSAGFMVKNGGAVHAATIKPHANNTYDLGSSSLRWANIYTQDLQLSNEAAGDNGIDGTWGDYTIVEGESDLFLKNNRSGKTYKFNLTEVS